MIRRLLLVTAWLVVGSAIVAGLFWALLNTPESNVLMLTISAILVVLMVVLSGIVVTTAVLLARGEALVISLKSGTRRFVWFVVLAAPIVLLTWAIVRGDQWIAHKSGEISAWFIAQFGWSDITPLFTAQSYLSIWLRWVLLPITALTALASLLSGGSLAPRAWLGRAWHWRPLLVATLAFIVLVALPWQAAFWTQEKLPATWVQPTLAGLRLGAIAISMALGGAIMVLVATKATERTMTNVAE